VPSVLFYGEIRWTKLNKIVILPYFPYKAKIGLEVLFKKFHPRINLATLFATKSSWKSLPFQFFFLAYFLVYLGSEHYKLAFTNWKGKLNLRWPAPPIRLFDFPKKKSSTKVRYQKLTSNAEKDYEIRLQHSNSFFDPESVELFRQSKIDWNSIIPEEFPANFKRKFVFGRIFVKSVEIKPYFFLFHQISRAKLF
jgi:hypothetical protein